MVVSKMFKNFNVKSSLGDYSVEFNNIEESLNSNLQEGDILLIDRNVWQLYPEIKELVKKNNFILVDATEESKQYSNIGKIIDQLINMGISKNNRLIAIGGGITQDIAGFSASIIFRGIDWFFHPTNLQSQADSCIGSKTSVNTDFYKNQLGNFYPPRKIFIDFNFLNTVSNLTIRSGLGEMLHYFLVDKKIEINEIVDRFKKAETSKEDLYFLISSSLSIKKNMIEIDEFDRGPRNIFNYGHTFGHALEASTNFSVPHGMAVSFGMDLANLISEKEGHISMNKRNKMLEPISFINKSFLLPKFDIEKYYESLKKDKKNIGSDINCILTRGKGNMFKTKLNLSNDIKLLIKSFYENKLYRTKL